MIELKVIDSGYYRLQGTGPCNFAQVPGWPCSITQLEEGFFPEASRSFREECIYTLEKTIMGQPTTTQITGKVAPNGKATS